VSDAVGDTGFCSLAGVYRCVGSSLSLESSDCGLGAAGSSSDDLGTCSLSDGRLSLSNSWILSRLIPRYGLLVLVSCSSSCQWPSYTVTALAFCPVCAGGLNKRMS
jgi:hypothetical protein